MKDERKLLHFKILAPWPSSERSLIQLAAGSSVAISLFKGFDQNFIQKFCTTFSILHNNTQHQTVRTALHWELRIGILCDCDSTLSWKLWRVMTIEISPGKIRCCYPSNLSWHPLNMIRRYPGIVLRYPWLWKVSSIDTPRLSYC